MAYGCVDDAREVYEVKDGRDGTPIIVIDQKTGPVIQEIRKNGAIIFKGTNFPKLITPGSIICSAPVENAPAGYFYKVKKIISEGENTKVETEFASLDEAIKEGSVDETFSLTSDIDYIEDANGKPISLVEETTKVDYSAGVTIPINISYNVDGVDFVFNGSVSVSGKYHFDFQFSDWSLQKFEMWAEPEMVIHSSVGANLSFKGELLDLRLCTIHHKPKVVVVYGIPVVITSKSEISIKSVVNGEIKIGCDLVDVEYKYRAGVCYYQDTGWSFVSENYSSTPTILNNISLFDLSGDISIDLPHFSYIPSFYGLSSDDNKVGMNMSFPFKLAVSNVDIEDIAEGYVNPKLKVTGGVSVGVFAKMKILSRAILNFSPIAKVYEYELINKHLYPQFSRMSVEHNENGLAKLSFSMENLDDCFFTKYSDYGVYWKEGDWTTNMKDGTERKESLGHLDLKSISPTCSNRHYDFDVTLYDLSPATTYSVRPYCVDVFTDIEHRANNNSFITNANEEGLQEKMLRYLLCCFYKATDGDNWFRNDFWCSNAPISSWYGISQSSNGDLLIDLSNNNLRGRVNFIDMLFNGHGLQYNNPDQIVNAETEISEAVDRLFSWIGHYTDVESYIKEVNAILNTDVEFQLIRDALSKITVLHLSGNDIRSLVTVGLFKLQEIKCDSNKGYMDFFITSGCEELKKVHLKFGSYKTTIIDISNCHQLSQFEIDDNILYAGYINASGCTSLRRFVDFYGEDVLISISYSPLSGSLYQDGSRFWDHNRAIAGHLNLSDCSSLERLYCEGWEDDSERLLGGLRCITLDGCVSLQSITLAGRMPSFSLSINCPSLQSFCLEDGCSINELTLLNCPSLQSFCMDIRCSINKLTLSNLNNLTDLFLSNFISEIKTLIIKECPIINTIDIVSLNVETLKVIECVGLEVLHCDDCSIRKLEVTGCSSLKELTCFFNHIIQQITDEWKIPHFQYDVLYVYWTEWDPDSYSYVTRYKKNEYGWYYPGEPEQGYHGR